MKAIAAVEERYAYWLALGTRAGVALLALAFLAYVFGLLPAHVPIEHLPRLWSRSALEYLHATGQHRGWGWLRLLGHSDVGMLVPIALLASWSIACLAAVIPLFRARGERVLVAVCLAQALVIVAAAFAPHA